MNALSQLISKCNIEIIIQGQIDKSSQQWFTGFIVSSKDDLTTIAGTVKDQSELMGLLSKIHGLCYPIKSVRNEVISVQEGTNDEIL